MNETIQKRVWELLRRKHFDKVMCAEGVWWLRLARFYGIGRKWEESVWDLGVDGPEMAEEDSLGSEVLGGGHPGGRRGVWKPQEGARILYKDLLKGQEAGGTSHLPVRADGGWSWNPRHGPKPSPVLRCKLICQQSQGLVTHTHNPLTCPYRVS